MWSVATKLLTALLKVITAYKNYLTAKQVNYVIIDIRFHCYNSLPGKKLKLIAAVGPGVL